MNSTLFIIFLAGGFLHIALTTPIPEVPTASPPITDNIDQSGVAGQPTAPGLSSPTMWVSPANANEITDEDKASAQADDISADLFDAISSPDLRAQGQKCVDAIMYVIGQTNFTFNRMCSEMDAHKPQEGRSFCTLLGNTDWPLQFLPSLDHFLASTQTETVYTNLLAMYNLTYQYTCFLVNVSRTLQCQGCFNIPCNRVEDMASSMQVGQMVSCRFRNLRLKFSYFLRSLGEMMQEMHGSIPPVQCSPPPMFEDFTREVEFSISALAEAFREMTRVKSLLVHGVINQL